MDYQNIINEIKKANTIAVISHINPDGDTVGSSLAIYKAIQMYGKKPYIFCDDVITDKLSFLQGTEDYNKAKLDKYDLTIAVDCADMERLGVYSAEEFKKGKRKMVIDHHKTNTKYGDINLIDINAAATAQIVTFLLKEMGGLNREVARLLYSGLVTDSGGFTFSNVTAKTMEAASILLEYDIAAHEICDHFLKKIKMNTYKLKARTLSNAKFYDNNQIGIISFLKKDFDETNCDNSSTEGMVNNIINVIGVRVAVAISEVREQNFKVSIRTGEDVDSSKIALMFGGGGHKNAAGFRVNGYYEDVVEKILKAVRDEICCSWE